MSVRIIGGAARDVESDLILTPYLLYVGFIGDHIAVSGIGIGWGRWSCYIGLGFNIPKVYRSFKIHRDVIHRDTKGGT